MISKLRWFIKAQMNFESSHWYESNSPVQKHMHKEEKVVQYEDKGVQNEDLHCCQEEAGNHI